MNDANDRSGHHGTTYTPKRSRWPGLLGAAAVIAAVLGATMWAQHDDAHKIEAPANRGAGATTPAQPESNTTKPSDGAGRTAVDNPNSAPSDPSDKSQVATRRP